MSNNKRVEEILTKAFNDFYDYITEKDIVKVAHEYSEKTVFKQASQEIQKMLVEAQTNGVAWAIKEIDYWHGASGAGEYGDKLYKGIKNKIRDSYQLETGLPDPAPNYPIKVKLQVVEQDIKDRE